ncbi:nitroreductase/quinone reductase family protein [Nocardioides sp. NPDC047086]|uniref:nitroreductase/quinone reductase family protein n=1 Tax=Nocardioides sp. NPDC047086 TaxID=3154810 RepID=UPI0033C38CF1
MSSSLQRPAGLDSPLTARVIKYGARANTALFKLTNGRIGGAWRVMAGWRKPAPVLLLEHIGRKSGRTFTTPLLFMRSGAELVVVGSQGGLPKDPQWVANLRAHPDVAVRVPRRGRSLVRARVANHEERAELWPRLLETYADFETYQTWTDREIPVIVLSPRS